MASTDSTPALNNTGSERPSLLFNPLETSNPLNLNSATYITRNDLPYGAPQQQWFPQPSRMSASSDGRSNTLTRDGQGYIAYQTLPSYQFDGKSFNGINGVASTVIIPNGATPITQQQQLSSQARNDAYNWNGLTRQDSRQDLQAANTMPRLPYLSDSRQKTGNHSLESYKISGILPPYPPYHIPAVAPVTNLTKNSSPTAEQSSTYLEASNATPHSLNTPTALASEPPRRLSATAYPTSSSPQQSSEQGQSLPPMVRMNTWSSMGESSSWIASSSSSSNDGFTYEVVVRQQPMRARMCGCGDKDRRAIDPPPILELTVKDENGTIKNDIMQSPFLVMHVTLRTPDGLTPMMTTPRLPGKLPILLGTLVSSPSILQDGDGKRGCYFIFPDLSVRLEGTFTLNFTLVNLEGDPQQLAGQPSRVAATTLSEVFKVYSPKAFPGMSESSKLSRAFAQQGYRIPIRKERLRSENGRRRKLLDLDDMDAIHSQVMSRTTDMPQGRGSNHDQEEQQHQQDSYVCEQQREPTTGEKRKGSPE
ncbi:hypothetical protein SmJEL517_g03151 [Synchytrium microbalum]|uniref:Velvet domain-containing protein n=1 Tax=Synchytrium microbalum TaxID=1806994 RepID=A0A507C3X5_9FUNG|nr:uncharacterized protein SmJEL517_g03151 [Synchytrium microbalum]TPX34171.1 hypothetical protein SmJEL517_g03151 [Synchytrium microbalum]